VAIIFILSGTHCHGDEVAAGVAQRLGYGRLEEQLLDSVSSRYGVSRDRLARALGGPKPLFNKFTREREKNVAYLRAGLAELILDDNVLLQGCAGNLAPRTIAHILRVCVIANLDYRVQQAMKAANLSEKDARKQIHADDATLSACTSYLIEQSPFAESLYDIVIPMHDSSVDDAVALICEQAAGPAVQTTERSQQAAEDFVLASKVAVALVEAGYDLDVHAERGSIVLLMNEYVVRQKRYEEQITAIASKVEGVTGVNVRLGPKYAPPSLNPWSNIEAPPKFLLVDDEKEFVHTLSERLQTRDLESAIAYDGEQALDMLEKGAPDVMVLDLMMPGIDGIEVLRRVKRDHPEVEVIILTGHGSDREREQAEELGAFAYLQKPANIDELAKVMREAYRKVDRRRADSGADRPDN